MKELPPHIHAAIDHYFQSMHGWTTIQRGQEMAGAILDLRHPVAVSIGVFSGRSTIAMGFAMRELGFGMCYGIDPYKVDAATEGSGDEADRQWWAQRADLERMARYAITQIWEHRLDQWVTLIRTSSQFIPQLFPEIGVLEIDGNHSEAASMRDVSLYVPRVVSGGWIFADDADWKTTQKAMAVLNDTCEFVKEVKPEGYCSYRIYRKP